MGLLLERVPSLLISIIHHLTQSINCTLICVLLKCNSRKGKARQSKLKRLPGVALYLGRTPLGNGRRRPQCDKRDFDVGKKVSRNYCVFFHIFLSSKIDFCRTIYSDYVLPSPNSLKTLSHLPSHPNTHRFYLS